MSRITFLDYLVSQTKFSFLFFTETHPWAGSQIASFWLVYTIQRQGTNRCRSIALARVLGSRWLEKLQAKWRNTCWFSDFVIITCGFFVTYDFLSRLTLLWYRNRNKHWIYTRGRVQLTFFFTFYFTKVLHYFLRNPPRIAFATCGLYMNLFFVTKTLK